MPEDVIQLAPDSTGAKVRTRSRTVGANTVHEQYVLRGKQQIVTSRYYFNSFRQLVPRAALTTTAISQPMFTIWNGGSNIISVRRMVIECDAVVGKASATVVPVLRLYRLTAAPTNGSTLTGVTTDTGDTALSATVVVRGDASGDGAISGTALTATANPTSPMWSQTLPIWGSTTLAGYQQPAVMAVVPDDPVLQSEDPIYLRASQGLMLRAEAPAATYGAGDWSLLVKAVIGEFTVP